jgi:hypothetical protein
MSVKLSASLPDGDRNGLDRITAQLVNEPELTHVALVILDSKELRTDVDTKSTSPTVRILAIEPIPPGEDAKELLRLHRRAFEDRTGKVQLPLDLERDLEEALGMATEEPDDPPSDGFAPPDEGGWGEGDRG